jgi:hypothetical protein
VNCGHSWCLRGSHVSYCQVISLARFKIGSSHRKTSDMGDTCLLQSFSSYCTFIMLYLYHEMDINYLVADELINIKNYLVTIASLV